MVANIILDACAALIILLLLIPCLSSPGRHFNRRKQELLLYASLLHLFTLCMRVIGAIYEQYQPESFTHRIFHITAAVPSLISAFLLVLCILCDGRGLLVQVHTDGAGAGVEAGVWLCVSDRRNHLCTAAAGTGLVPGGDLSRIPFPGDRLEYGTEPCTKLRQR